MKNISCSNCYFQAGDSALVSTSQTQLNIGNKGGLPAGYNISAKRPFIPYVGLDSAGVPLSIASNQGNSVTFFDWFNAAWYASENWATENVLDKDLILNGDDNPFASYLFKTISSRAVPILTVEDRFHFMGSIVKNFWDNADLAWTPAQYQEALQKFVAFLSSTLDFNLYLAPADYQFLSAAPTPNDSGLGADILAWKTADPTLALFGCIEIYV
jgi:hypothetical protein